MAKKSVDAGLAAYSSKGMKAPRPAAYGKMDQSAAPKNSPSMQHKEPSHPVSSGDQSMAPDHKKKALPMQDAPEGVSGVNGGSSLAMPKGGAKGESEV
jgi:hypothetical protein